MEYMGIGFMDMPLEGGAIVFENEGEDNINFFSYVFSCHTITIILGGLFNLLTKL